MLVRHAIIIFIRCTLWVTGYGIRLAERSRSLIIGMASVTPRGLHAEMVVLKVRMEEHQ